MWGPGTGNVLRDRLFALANCRRANALSGAENCGFFHILLKTGLAFAAQHPQAQKITEKYYFHGCVIAEGAIWVRFGASRVRKIDGRARRGVPQSPILRPNQDTNLMAA